MVQNVAPLPGFRQVVDDGVNFKQASVGINLIIAMFTAFT
jgi:hypothetical protein